MNRGEYTSFEIKVGGVYKLVGCLTAAPMTESAETIPTTTRENNGWTTELATNQSYEISLEGLAKKDGVNLPGNTISYFVLREMKRARQIIEYRIVNLDGWFVDVGKAVITEIGYTDTAGELVTFSATLRGFGKPTGQLVNPDATQVGGRNLLLKTGDPASFLSQGSLIGFQIRKTNGDGIEAPNGANGFYIFGGSGDEYTGYSAILELKPNTEYTLSYDFSWSGTIASSSYYFLGDSPLAVGSAYNIPYTQPQSAFYKVAIKFKTDSTNVYFKLRLGKTGANVYWLFFANFKLEEGNKATPWTPAPEDI